MICFFKDDYEKVKRKVGGKAKNLIRLTAEGFNVPKGFVITNILQKQFFERNKIDIKIKESLEELKSSDFTISSKAAKNIRDAIINSDFTKEEIDIINNAIEKIQLDNKLAVRSSCEIEDGENNSWAGQFDTFLNVDKIDILEYIKRTWASMFGSKAISYNANLIFKNTIPNFSVIIQEMINGDYSGIGFSKSPETNDLSHIRIETIKGTGENVVSGRENPYSVTISRDDGLIIKRTFGSEGKVELIKPSVLKELMEQIVKIENIFNEPVDIEWTIKDDQKYILQARPITADFGQIENNNINDLPDILDYELTFKAYGLGFMFADLLCRGFGYLQPLFICSNGEFLQYFPNERMEYAAKYGYRWLSRKGGFDEHRIKFTEFHKKSFGRLQKIANGEQITQDDAKEFFNIIYNYFIFYSKTDYQFTNLTYLYADENPIIADSLKKISIFKDIARVWINDAATSEDCLLNKFITNIAKKFNVSEEELQFYKINEIFELFKNIKVSTEDLNLRSNNTVVMTNGIDIKYLYGNDAKIYIDKVESIRKSQENADIIGQVANRSNERYVTGVVRLINVDYANPDKIELDMNKMKQGEILVVESTYPELMPACKKAKAIVSDLGGMLSHQAIVSRELEIPCVVGTDYATRSLKNGDFIKIDLDLGTIEKCSTKKL